jgi:hypothetical protein
MATAPLPLARNDGPGIPRRKRFLIVVMLGLATAAPAQVSITDALGSARIPFFDNHRDQIVLADLDGDSLAEALLPRGSHGQPYVIDFAPDPGDWKTSSISPANSPGGSWVHTRAGEVHGDGRTDLIVWLTGELSVLSGAENLATHHWIESPAFFYPDLALALDLTGDGLTDLVELDEVGTDSDLHVMRCVGAGQFESVGITPAFAAGETGELLAADMDGDSLPDLVLARESDGEVSVSIGAGGTSFGPTTTAASTPGATSHHGSTTIDLDRDGDMDVIQILSLGSSPSVLSECAHLNDGAGSLSSLPPTALAEQAFRLDAIDVNADGHDELLMFGSSRLILRVTSAVPGQAHEVSLSNLDPMAVAAADLDCDGRIDLAMASGDDYVVALIATGDLEFSGLDVVVENASADLFAPDDLDGDGLTDMVTLDNDTGDLTVLSGTPQGLVATASQLLPTTSARVLELADVDADGLVDVVLGAGGGGISNPIDGTVRLSLGLSPSTFGSLSEIDVGEGVNDLALGDLNGDGDLDCVTPSFEVLAFDQGGFQAPTNYNIYSADFGVDLADIDDDGDLDGVSGGTKLLLGDGLGGFLSPYSMTIVPGGSHPGHMNLLETGDLDLDGDVDVVGARNGTFGSPTRNVSVALNDGLGGMTIVQVSSNDEFLRQVALIHVDGDGFLDLLTASDVTSQENHVAVWLGDGAGALLEPTVTTLVPDSNIGIADLDHDGDADWTYRTDDTIRSIMLRTSSLAPHTALGASKSGTLGHPVLKAYGTLQPDSPLQISLCNARPYATSHLVLGLSAVEAPFKGGIMVPLPVAILMGIPVDPDGSMAGSFDWPDDVPTGFELYLQFWIEDPQGAHGVAASNGLRMVAP